MSIEAKQRQESAGAYSNAFNAKAENPSAPKRAEDDYILTHYRNGLEAKPDNDDYDPEEDDISADKFGAKAIAGNIFSNKKSQNDENQSVREREERREQKSREEARRIAEWDETPVMVGGVKMTNAQALKALQNINKNMPAYTQLAKDKGLIKEGQEKEFEENARRTLELKLLERENKLSSEQKKELEQRENSTMGRALSTLQADNFKNNGVAPDPKASLSQASVDLSRSNVVTERVINKETAILNENIFNAKPLTPEFTASAANISKVTEPSTPQTTVAAATPPKKDSKAGGFDMNG